MGALDDAFDGMTVVVVVALLALIAANEEALASFLNDNAADTEMTLTITAAMTSINKTSARVVKHPQWRRLGAGRDVVFWSTIGTS